MGGGSGYINNQYATANKDIANILNIMNNEMEELKKQIEYLQKENSKLLEIINLTY